MTTSKKKQRIVAPPPPVEPEQIQLGCRALPQEKALIEQAMRYTRQTRNAFIVTAAINHARSILQAEGVNQESLVAESV